MMKKHIVVSFSLFALSATVAPSRAQAQVPGLITAPPCERGAIYVGGSSREDAYCIDRRYWKTQRAEHWERREGAREVARRESRRMKADRVRTVYLHPNVRRVRERGGYELTGPRSRWERSVPATEIEFGHRLLRRRGEPAVTRQDVSPRARQTVRTMQEREKSRVRHSRLRERTGR